MIDSTSNKYLVVDVTTLMKWNRSPVGIIRTQLEFIYFLVNNDPSAIYFQFNNTKDDFIVVSKSQINKVVLNLLNFKNEQNNFIKPHAVIKNRFLHSQIDLLRKVFQIYKKEGLKIVLIKACKKKCSSKVKDLAKKIYISLFSNKNSVNGHLISNSVDSVLFSPEISQAQSFTPSFLSRNSIVVSIGLDWDNSNYPLLYWLKKRIGFEFVGAFYDGIPVVYPELVQSFYFSQKFFSHLYYLVHLSDKVFCISDYSNNQLSELCDEHHIYNKPVLKTIHLGDSVSRETDIAIQTKRNYSSNYVVYVSTVEARKNHKLLLSVWKNLLKDNSIEVPDLVLVGMMGWGIDDLKEIYSKDKELQKVIHFYDDVDDMELVTIYNNAKFTVFPSFVEGWGLGAVESMLYNKPCIISDCSALTEATQGLMPSVNPSDVKGWTEIIKLLIKDENKLNELKQSIKDKFQSRSWKEFSEEFMKFIKDEV